MLKATNNKGHFAFSAKETIVIVSIIYSMIFAVIFSVSGVIAIILKTLFFKQHSLTKMVWIIAIIITLSLVAYGYISQWYWQHYGFYYSYRDNPYITKYDPQYELKENGEIYHCGKPFIVKGKYYGWESVKSK